MTSRRSSICSVRARSDRSTTGPSAVEGPMMLREAQFTGTGLLRAGPELRVSGRFSKSDAAVHGSQIQLAAAVADRAAQVSRAEAAGHREREFRLDVAVDGLGADFRARSEERRVG